MHTKSSPTHVKDSIALSEFDGLWKHQNNPACTKSVSLRNFEVGRYTEEEGSKVAFTVLPAMQRE